MTASAWRWVGQGGVSHGSLLHRKTLLLCGAVASVLYLGTDLLAGLLWEGYSFVDQAISELSAIGAPTRPLVIALGLVYSVLMLAFGWGVRWQAKNRALRVTGMMLLGIGVLGFVWLPFPIHVLGSEATWVDTVHSVLAGVNVALFLLAMGFGAFALGTRFRIYSLGTLAALLVAGTASFLVAAAQVSAQGILAPPPRFGLLERLDAYVCVMWVTVLAVVLLRQVEGTFHGSDDRIP